MQPWVLHSAHKTFCSPRSPTFKGAASLLSAVTAPRKSNTRIAQGKASLPGQYSYCPGSGVTLPGQYAYCPGSGVLNGKYRDASAMAVASLQRGSFVQQRRKNSSKYATRHPWATNRLTLGFYGRYGLFPSVVNYTALGLRPRAV